MDDVTHYNAHVEVSGSDYADLYSYAFTEHSDPQNAHAVLTRIFTHVNMLENYKEPSINEIIGEFFGGTQNIFLLVSILCTIIGICTV